MRHTHERRRAITTITGVAALLLVAVGYLLSRASRHIFERFEIDERFGLVHVHHVSPDNRLTPEPSAAGQRTWEQFLAIATPEFVSGRVVEYHVANQPNARYFAETSSEHDNNDRWKLIVNVAVADQKELFISTLVHEYAHLFSLDSSQFDDDASVCHTVLCEGGCAREDSFIWAFYTSFWQRYGSAAPHPDNNDTELSNAFYEEHQEDFVTDYAALNVIEDFAESFMTFVFTDVPTGDTLADDKVRFFWDRLDLVDRRLRIRGVLGL